MRDDAAKRAIQEILSQAGVTINGDQSWDLKIKDKGFYQRVLNEGSLGFGESYVDGWWECEDLAEFFCRLLLSDPESKIRKNLKLISYIIQSRVVNPGRKSRAFQIGEKHYDIGNELYKNMLDKRMIYSCAYWKDAGNLDDAQEAKLDLICRKLGLQTGDKILDVGCGWGGLVKYACEKYGVEAVGITVSGKQLELARERCKGLPVEIRLQDYRDVEETFDHVVSVGMFEHVGYKNYGTYMKVVHRCLKDDGLFLLHTIGSTTSKFTVDPWMGKYIFPNSLIPSMKQISAAIEKLFVLEDVHNFGSYYDPTLISWFNNLDKSWERLKNLYDERFYRIWKYYLLSSAGSFRSRYSQVWQIVLSKKGAQGGYVSIR